MAFRDFRETFRARNVFGSFEKRAPGARFSKVPKLFGHISGYIILFVSSERRRLGARNFAFILIFMHFTTNEKTRFPEPVGRGFTNGFSGPKSFPDFRETGPSSPYFLAAGKGRVHVTKYHFCHIRSMSPYRANVILRTR